jgi:Raf kinase inhibitor-like YbhB/YbcL family protein
MSAKHHTAFFGWIALMVCLAGVLACSSRSAGGALVSLELKSTDFSSGGTIPKQFTCDGADLSPALEWSAPPAGTQSFALIADDPDAPVGTWVHWVAFNLPAGLRSLPQGVPKQEQLADGALQGRNDFGRIGFGGPCPPPGKAHRYFFKLYALDTKLSLKSGATRKDVERAMQNHVLAQGEYMGRYSR